ncbi:hypothetical protein Syun_017935 [Stephania yunnanensis]|uniref:Uncharacterized protein n=1 Tax=Stephania yunnanensis TaxID=152371 RepID=A0AAP0ISS8_9MAGN
MAGSSSVVLNTTTHTLVIVVVAVMLLVHQQGYTAFGRKIEVHAPSSVAAVGDNKDHGSYRKSRITPPAPAAVGFVINRYKMMEGDAYRPTSPGHSPGIGHTVPPGGS